MFAIEKMVVDHVHVLARFYLVKETWFLYHFNLSSRKNIAEQVKHVCNIWKGLDNFLSKTKWKRTQIHCILTLFFNLTWPFSRLFAILLIRKRKLSFFWGMELNTFSAFNHHKLNMEKTWLLEWIRFVIFSSLFMNCSIWF